MGNYQPKLGDTKHMKKKKSKNLNDKFTLTLGSQIMRSTIQSLFNGLLMFMNNAKLTCLQLVSSPTTGLLHASLSASI